MSKAQDLFRQNKLREKPTKIFEKWGNHVHRLVVGKDTFINWKWRMRVRYFESKEHAFARGGMPQRQMMWGTQLVIKKGPRVLFRSKSHGFHTPNKGAMSFKLQPVNVAHRLSTTNHYNNNILERPQLEYHILEREGLLRPARGTSSR